MKATTGIGIGFACMALFLGMTMEGTSVGALINIPAGLFVIGGTFGVTVAGTSIERIKAIPGLYGKVMKGFEADLVGRVEQLVSFSDIARRDGLLALEEPIGQLEDRFSRKGLQMVVDGADPVLVEEVLAHEMDSLEERHGAARLVFEKAGGLAPTMGILGTVLGLVHVLGNLDQPATLGEGISGAFIATLFGVGMANVVFFPVANHLKEMSRDELLLLRLTMHGILGIQEGENPRVLREKLMSFVPPDMVAAAEASSSRQGATAAAASPEPVAA